MRCSVCWVLFGLLLGAMACGRTLTAQTADGRDADLLGLWGVEAMSGPQVAGPIVLERRAGEWTMRISGHSATAPVAGDSVRLVLPGGQGTLRVPHLASGVARGFWIQPAGDRPSYATPVVLTPDRAGEWRGTVAPLDDRLALYLLITRDASDSLRGVFRNPDFNWTGGAPWFRVVRDGERLRFLDPASGRERHVQPYDSAQRRIVMDFGTPIALTPRTRDGAAGFYPRSPAGPDPAYRVPDAAGDGWTVAAAADVGLDPATLGSLVRAIASADPAADGPRIHGVLVARHGKLVLEEYFFGYDADRLHDLRSASKTFTSVMAGAVIEAGAVRLDTPVHTFFPGVASDGARSRITLAHLLTHSSGLACDDNDGDSPGSEDRMQSQDARPDWYRYVLGLPMAHEPGSTYAYCSGGMNLAGGVLRQATDESVLELFDRTVAVPLGITRYAVNLMPTGDMYAGGGVYLRPRDLLKLGAAYLRGGVWNGARVASAAWVRRSTAHRIDAPDGSSDGYGWHRHTLHAGGRDYPVYEANGNGGQFLIVVPELDLAVVFTAGNYGQYGIWRKFRDELVPRYIIGAVRP